MVDNVIRGIDVSSMQGMFDWGKARDSLDLQFAIVKCTQGNEPFGHASQDTFNRYVYGAMGAGLKAGAYHFLYPLPWGDGHPARRSPTDQAQAFFGACQGLGSAPGELPPCVDFEWPALADWTRWGVSAAQMVDHCLETLAEVERLFRRIPCLYSYPDFWRLVKGGTRAEFAHYPLWMAKYDYKAGDTFTPWASPTLVQISGGEGPRLPNGAKVDHDIFVGDDAAWTAFTG